MYNTNRTKPSTKVDTFPGFLVSHLKGVLNKTANVVIKILETKKCLLKIVVKLKVLQGCAPRISY